MRIRPLYIALIAVAAGAAYSIVSVVASFAEIKSVGERVTAAAHARAQRSPPAEALVVPDAARVEAEPGGGVGRPGSFDPVDRLPAAREPSAAAERYDAAAEEIDNAAVEDRDAAEEEQRYLEKAGRHDDSATSDLDGRESTLPPEGEEDPGFAETVDDADPTLGDTSDEDAEQQ